MLRGKRLRVRWAASAGLGSLSASGAGVVACALPLFPVSPACTRMHRWWRRSVARVASGVDDSDSPMQLQRSRVGWVGTRWERRKRGAGRGSKAGGRERWTLASHKHSALVSGRRGVHSGHCRCTSALSRAQWSPRCGGMQAEHSASAVKSAVLSARSHAAGEISFRDSFAADASSQR